MRFALTGTPLAGTVRLWGGLTLFTYVLLHLSNRALGLISHTVHVAARLEALTKEYECDLVISDAVAVRAGVPTTDLARHDLTLRNRQAPLAVLVVNDARRLAARLAGAGDTVSASP